jgi:hypothetical protein
MKEKKKICFRHPFFGGCPKEATVAGQAREEKNVVDVIL